MQELTLNQWMMVGLMVISYLFILFKTGEWITSALFRKWDKRRTLSRRQKAVNEMYDAFELDQLERGNTVRLATKGNLTIMMFREEES